jgi:serine/alanine racemase
MAVVKANAYGHGDREVCHYLNKAGYKSFAVATLDEAALLREAGTRGSITILGYTPANCVQELMHYKLIQTIADASHARDLHREAMRLGVCLPVQLKVDTGMNRLGEKSSHVDEIADLFTLPHLSIGGIFSHLCVADTEEASDVTYTKEQIRKYEELLHTLRERGIKFDAAHIQNSFATLHYHTQVATYARVGLALYGAANPFPPYALRSTQPQTPFANDLLLAPVLSLYARVVLVREIEAGESVGYGRAYTADTARKIAVVSIGYADGLPRSYAAGGGIVCLHGIKVPIIGRICMDQMMIDVTHCPMAQRGDVVTIIGGYDEQQITVEEVAARAGTIPNDILCRLPTLRLKRFFIDRQDTLEETLC